MKKNGILGGLILLIALAVFNVIAFVLPHEYGGAFWCGYIFTTLAFILQALFAFIAFGKADNIKKTFLGLPVAQLGITYLIIQLIWGLICISVSVISVQIAVVISVVLLGVYAIAIIIAMIGRDVVTDIDAKVKVKTFFMKSLLVDVEIVMAKTENSEIKALLNNLAETAKYCDPMSNEALQNVEGRINDKYNELETAIDTNDIQLVETICKELNVLFVERNNKCKLLK